MAAVERLRDGVKLLRGLLQSDSPEKQVKCEVKTLLAYFHAHYENPERYQDRGNVLQILSGRSRSPLESAFMWMGAWRPSAAVSLVFSVMGLTKQGIQLEIPVNALQKSGKLICLTPEQIAQLKSFRDHASLAEKDLNEELATIQMMLPDQDIVTHLMKDGKASAYDSSLQEMIEAKVGSLSDVLKRADQLRIKTLLQLHTALLPVQAAHCVIAAFEVAFVMRTINSATPASTS